MCTSFGIDRDEKIDDMWQQQKIIKEPIRGKKIVTEIIGQSII